MVECVITTHPLLCLFDCEFGQVMVKQIIKLSKEKFKKYVIDYLQNHLSLFQNPVLFCLLKFQLIYRLAFAYLRKVTYQQ